MKTSLHRLIVVFSTAFVATITSASAQNSDWTGYLFDLGHSSHNAAATAITPGNASTLVADWTFTDPQPMPGQPNASLYSTPTVVNGVVYIGSNTGMFYALDEDTGAMIWQQLLGFTTPKTCGSGHGVTSTATMANDPVSGAPTLYVGGGDGYFYALNPTNGDILYRQFVTDVGSGNQNLGFIWGSPTVLNGRVYLGWASACDNPLVRSGMKAFDQHTGTLLKTFWTLPKGSIGAGVWSTAASNGKSIWFTTGNGDEGGYSFAIVKLNANNMRLQSAWVNPDGNDDLDWGSSPTLFEAKINGKRTQMVGANGKDGIFHALDADRLENGPIWSFQVGTTADFTIGTCLAAPIWDSTSRTLFVASNLTTINGQSFRGSVRAFDPADGTIRWETGLTGGPVMGSPTLNGSGVLAAATYNSSVITLNAVYLLNALTGAILNTIPESGVVTFAQPVFSGNHLFIANANFTTSTGKLTAFIPSALKASKK